MYNELDEIESVNHSVRLSTPADEGSEYTNIWHHVPSTTSEIPRKFCSGLNVS